MSEAVYEGNTQDVQLIEGTTIGKLLDETCRNHGLQEALVFVDEQVQLTFTQLSQQVDKMAAGFLALGLKPGDRIVLWGANHSNNLLAVYACAKVGLIFNCLSHACTADALKQHTNSLEAKALVCFPTVKPGHCYEILKGLEPKIEGSKGSLSSSVFSHLKFIVVDEGSQYKGAYQMSEIVALGSKDKSECAKLVTDAASSITADSIAAIMTTSGTVDNSQCCFLSHYQLINSCLVTAKRLNLHNKSEILCCPLPIFRGPVLCFSALATAILGTKTVYPSALPMPPAIFESVQNQKCTCLLANPIALHLMLRMPAAKKFTLESIKSVCLQGDHTSSEQASTFMEKLPNLEDIAGGVSLTEAGCMPFIYPPRSKLEDIGKWDGKIADHYAVKILGFDGQPAQFTKAGQVCLKLVGKSKFLGYMNSSKTCTSDDWFLTDDVGTLSTDGFVSLLGKTGEIIFKDKQPIIPCYIEKVLSSHSAIFGCQVVGAPDDKCGEKIIACLVKKSKDVQDDDGMRNELLKMCKDEKVPVPDKVLFFEDFPRNQAKKVHKAKLKAMVKDMK